MTDGPTAAPGDRSGTFSNPGRWYERPEGEAGDDLPGGALQDRGRDQRQQKQQPRRRQQQQQEGDGQGAADDFAGWGTGLLGAALGGGDGGEWDAGWGDIDPWQPVSQGPPGMPDSELALSDVDELLRDLRCFRSVGGVLASGALAV